MLVVTLSCMLPVLGGCAGVPDHPGMPLSQEEVRREADLEGWNLSAESEHFYYHLLLSEGLYTRNPLVTREALRGILNINPSLEVFQDCVAQLMQHGEYDSAIIVAEEGLGRFPFDPVLTLSLTEMYAIMGNLAEGVSLLEKHLATNPEDFAAMHELIRFYLMQEKPDQAQALIGRIPANQRTQQYDLFRARILSAKGNNPSARSVLNNALKKYPGFTAAWLELGLVESSSGNVEAALEAYHTAAELEPANLNIRMQLVRMLVQGNRPDEAVIAASGSPSAVPFLLQAAYILGEAGFSAQAELLVQQALDRGASADETALFLSVLRLQSTGDPRAAIMPLEAVREDHPAYVEAMLRKIQLTIEAGDLSTAAAIAGKARNSRPEVRQFWGAEAYSLIQENRVQEALVLLREGLKRFPEDDDLLYSYGRTQDAAGDVPGAMLTMERLLAKSPRHAEALNYVGYMLAEQNRQLDRAHELIRAALLEKPDAAHIVDSLAWVQYRLGLVQDAWQTIRLSLSLGEDSPVAWEHYSAIALALGLTDEARQGLVQALVRNPANPDDLKNRLDALEGRNGHTQEDE